MQYQASITNESRCSYPSMQPACTCHGWAQRSGRAGQQGAAAREPGQGGFEGLGPIIHIERLYRAPKQDPAAHNGSKVASTCVLADGSASTISGTTDFQVMRCPSVARARIAVLRRDLAETLCKFPAGPWTGRAAGQPRREATPPPSGLRLPCFAAP